MIGVQDLNPTKRKALIQVLGAITYGELKAYDGASEQARLSSNDADRKTYRKIAAEELRHHKGFSRRLEALGADVQRAMRPYKESLDSFHSKGTDDPVAEAVAGFLGEGIAADMLGWLKKVADTETAEFIETVIADEVGHEAIASARLRSLLEAEPGGRRRAEVGIRQMLLRMLGAGGSRGTSSLTSFGAFLQLGHPTDLVGSLVAGMARRVRELGISPVAPLLPVSVPLIGRRFGLS
ncbi:MAG TPA: ferritin-like fold-containing protein [Acidimicrobiales bacterium]|nr:ferritin-like fold-containing protein [Acidimicrobiales bacterium]